MTIANKLTLLEQTKEAQRVKLGLPKSMPFSQYQYYMQPWSIADLYKNGEQGVWFDSSNLSTMFQDVDGAESVTKDGAPVGLILDKSQNIVVQQAYANSIPSLQEYSGSYGGSVSVEANALIVKNPEGGDRGHAMVFYKDLDSKLAVGRTYKFSIFISEIVGTPAGRVSIFPFGLWGNIADASKLVQGINKDKLKIGWNSFYYTRKSNDILTTNTHLRLPALTLDGEGSKTTYSSIKIEEVKGSHATQGTASARPIYRTDGNLHWLEFDGVDDTLTTQPPSGAYTEIKASRDGVTHKYPVNVSGTYTLGNLTQTKQIVSGLVLVNRQLTQAEIENVTNLMKVKAGLPL